MKLWRLIARGEMEVLAQQIKTSTKLSENSLCDTPPINTVTNIVTNVGYVDTSSRHVALGKQCRICKQDFTIESYDSPRIYCPDCEKALGEIIKWWNGTARDWWIKNNAKKDRE